MASTVEQNALTGLIGGLVLGFIGWLVVPRRLLQGSNWGTDMVVTVTMVGWVLGFNIGVGTFNAPIRWMLGHDQSYEDELYAAGVTQGKRALLEVLHRPQGGGHPVPGAGDGAVRGGRAPWP